LGTITRTVQVSNPALPTTGVRGDANFAVRTTVSFRGNNSWLVVVNVSWQGNSKGITNSLIATPQMFF